MWNACAKFAAALALGLGLFGAGGSLAADFPGKPVRLVVPYVAGGATDVLFRNVAQSLEGALGQPVVIANIAGAGGAVGTLEAATAAPDGYTLGVYQTITEIAQAVGTASFSDDDLKPVALIGDLYLSVIVTGDSEFNSLQDIAAAAKANPGEVSVAVGAAELSQFAAVMLEKALGEDIKIENVGSGAQKRAALLGGHVDAFIEPTSSVLAQHRSGELKVLATLSPERLETTQDIATAREQGVDLVVSLTNGLFAPIDTPDDRVAILADAVEEALQNEEFVKRADELGLDIRFMRGAEFQAHMEETRASIFETAKELGF